MHMVLECFREWDWHVLERVLGGSVGVSFVLGAITRLSDYMV